MRGSGRRHGGRGMGKRQCRAPRHMGRGNRFVRLNPTRLTAYRPSSHFFPIGLEDRKSIRRTPRLVSRVDAERCVACGTCEEVCPAGAISVEDIARVDPTLCVGCGLCVDECPQGALSLGAPTAVRTKTPERME